jgi:MFS family permease
VSSFGVPPPSAHGLPALLHVGRLRLLVLVRVLSSFGDGAFQGALVGAVLFSPENAASPGDLAFGFAVMLMPYSVVGPFLGSLLDRWSRRQVLVWASLVRCLIVAAVALQIAYTAPLWLEFSTALVVLGAGRFVNSCFSAAMPHCVAPDSLVGANSLATTAGSISTALGGAAAFGAGALLGSSDLSLALITAGVIPFYAFVALAARRFGRMSLGPDETDEPSSSILAILGGFGAGFHHMRTRPRVGVAVTMVMLGRFCFGLATLLVLVLFQQVFSPSGFFRAGPAGIVQVLGFGAAGVFTAALLTAPAVSRMGRTTWVTAVLLGAGVVSFVAAIRLDPPIAMAVAFLLGFAYQASKICADAVVQSDCDDAHIGRVYSLYDTTNNVLYVLGFIVGAAFFTEENLGTGLIIVLGVIYWTAGLGFRWGMRRFARHPTAVDLVPAHS